MVEQVLVRDLPFGYRDAVNYLPPYVSQDISGAMDLKFFIHPIPSMIGLEVIKVQE